MSTHPELYEEAVKQEEAELASDLDAKEKQIKQASDAMLNVFSSMQSMENAPKDRNILIKLANSDEYIIAKYAEWDAPKSRYDKVWEVEPGQCFVYNSKELEGWWDLPKSAKT